MKRTALALEPGILRQVKLRAASAGTTLQAEVNALLRQALRAPLPTGVRLELQPFDTTLNPGIDLFDRNSLYRAMDAK